MAAGFWAAVCLQGNPSLPWKLECSHEDKELTVGVNFTPKMNARGMPVAWVCNCIESDKDIQDKMQAGASQVPLLGPIN